MAGRIPLRFYKTDAGGEPVLEWLKGLPAAHRKLIGQDLATLQEGWPVGMPLCDSLGKGLWEARTTLPPDNTRARVFICQIGDELVALHAVIKKRPKADPDDIAEARGRMNKVSEEYKRLMKVAKKEKQRGR